MPKNADQPRENKRPTQAPLPRAWRADIDEAVRVVRAGGLILYPTDTVWGIGCDATNPEAVARVFALKQRVDAKALITLIDNEAKLAYFVPNVPETAWDLMEYSTRPLTIIYDGARNLAPNLMAADGSAALRVTHERFSKALCFRLRGPLVSTSANISGHPAPATFADIESEIVNGVDYVCTSRREERKPAKPSSIVKLGAKGEIKIIRN